MTPVIVSRLPGSSVPAWLWFVVIAVLVLLLVAIWRWGHVAWWRQPAPSGQGQDEQRETESMLDRRRRGDRQ